MPHTAKYHYDLRMPTLGDYKNNKGTEIECSAIENLVNTVKANINVELMELALIIEEDKVDNG